MKQVLYTSSMHRYDMVTVITKKSSTLCIGMAKVLPSIVLLGYDVWWLTTAAEWCLPISNSNFQFPIQLPFSIYLIACFGASLAGHAIFERAVML